jgi:hypothetical protein
MKPVTQPFVLRGLALWTSARAAWMSYFLLLDLRTLVALRNNGPFLGIGVDHKLILIISAMPLQLISIVAGFRFGRAGEVSAEVSAALFYGFVALEIWRRKKKATVFAGLLLGIESFLLALCIRYALWTTLLPEFRQFAVSSGLTFLVIYGLCGVYLIRQRSDNPLGKNSISEIA